MSYPIQIGPRSLPGVKIGDSWLSFSPTTHVFHLDTPEFYKASCGLKGSSLKQWSVDYEQQQHSAHQTT